MERQSASVYRVYQQRLAEASAVDFDDIINLTVRIFQEYPEVLDHYRQQWEHILVDEFHQRRPVRAGAAAGSSRRERMRGGGHGPVRVRL